MCVFSENSWKIHYCKNDVIIYNKDKKKRKTFQEINPFEHFFYKLLLYMRYKNTFTDKREDCTTAITSYLYYF